MQQMGVFSSRKLRRAAPGASPAPNERVDHDVLERVRRGGVELVLEPHDLVVEPVLALLAGEQLERLHQVRGVGQRHAAAGHVDDQSSARCMSQAAAFAFASFENKWLPVESS